MQTTLSKALKNHPAWEPTLIVDERERREIRETLMRSGLSMRIETLDLGDYLVSKEIAIERKRGDDLAGSLCDTRFFTQLTRLAAHYRCPILLLENFQKMFTRNIYDASLYGALVYTCAKLGIRILPSQDAAHTVKILTYLLTKYQKTRDDSPRKVTLPKEGVDRSAQLYFLQGLLDVSEKKSHTLLDHFGTPWHVIQAIQDSKISYTSTGSIKGVAGSFADLKGFGAKFVLRNAMLIRYPFEKAKKINRTQLKSL